jgi:hypothetical protein
MGPILTLSLIFLCLWLIQLSGRQIMDSYEISRWDSKFLLASNSLELNINKNNAFVLELILKLESIYDPASHWLIAAMVWNCFLYI